MAWVRAALTKTTEGLFSKIFGVVASGAKNIFIKFNLHVHYTTHIHTIIEHYLINIYMEISIIRKKKKARIYPGLQCWYIYVCIYLMLLYIAELCFFLKGLNSK